MTGPAAGDAHPTPEQVAEALADMRSHPQWVEQLGDVSKVIVRAALAAETETEYRVRGAGSHFAGMPESDLNDLLRYFRDDIAKGHLVIESRTVTPWTEQQT